MSFTDKVVIITGASAGIGACIAINFAKEGANTIIAGRNQERLNQVAEECSKYGPEPLTVQTNISEESGAELLINKTIEKFGKIDILVNNAGIMRYGSVLDGKLLSAYDEIMNTNVRPVLHLIELSASHLIKTKGNIVNVSSIAGLRIDANVAAYGLSKAALDHFTKTTAQCLAPKGIRVNSVNPGPTKTDILTVAGADEKVWNDLAQKSALKRVNDAEEIANMVLYVASEKAKGVTGSLFIVDNGFLINN